MMILKTVHYLDIKKTEPQKMLLKRIRTLLKIINLIKLLNLLRNFKLKSLNKDLILHRSMMTLQIKLQLTMVSILELPISELN